MALSEIELFMAAIRRLESGSFDGNYTVAKESLRHSTMGVPLGAYQIMSANWPSWSAQAGIPGASWQSKAAQDRVARHKMTQYYNTFGDWRLVAIAWFGGPGAAKKAAAQGLDSVGGRKDVLGTSISGYVKQIVSYMHEAADRGYGPTTRPDVEERLDPQARAGLGQLSVDQPLFGSPDVQVQSPLMYGDLPGANPDLTPLQDYTSASPQAQRGNAFDEEFQGRRMHQTVSAILQGISNSIKAGAKATGTQAPISDREREMMTIEEDVKRT